jgi:ATP-dependent helicase HrpB
VPHDLALSRAIPEGDIPAYLLACAYPDRIAQRRDGGQHHRYLLAGGGGAELAPRDPLKMRRYLAVSHLQGDANGARILGALALNESLLESALAELTTNAVESRFDQERGALVTLETRRLGAIVLRERPMTRASPEEAQAALLSVLPNSPPPEASGRGLRLS